MSLEPQKNLTIDDEKEYFEEDGHTVNCSNDGLEGVEKVKSFGPAIILLDMRSLA